MHTWPSVSTETIWLPLARVSDCEVRSVIRFLRTHGETAVEIHRQILAVYSEEHHLSKSMVCCYFTGKRFNTTEKIKAVVVEYFQNLDAEYCCAGLQKLHNLFTKCLDLQGDYVGK